MYTNICHENREQNNTIILMLFNFYEMNLTLYYVY